MPGLSLSLVEPRAQTSVRENWVSNGDILFVLGQGVCGHVMSNGRQSCWICRHLCDCPHGSAFLGWFSSW